MACDAKVGDRIRLTTTKLIVNGEPVPACLEGSIVECNQNDIWPYLVMFDKDEFNPPAQCGIGKGALLSAIEFEVIA